MGCGRQRRSGRAGSQRLRRRLVASTGAARTAHTPEAGRGAAAIRAQSPLANSCGWPCTCSVGAQSTRPLAASTGRPLAAKIGRAHV